MPRRGDVADRLASDLASLSDLDLHGLRRRWQGCYGTAPPPFARATLLRLGIAYRLQEQALGGLSRGTRQVLQTMATKLHSGTPLPAERVRLKPGTRLVRVWRGTTYEVVVQPDAFLFRGREHRSLSEIARTITGQRWSGPLFFGLKQPSVSRTAASA